MSRRSRFLSAEERLLWTTVARTVTPLGGRMTLLADEEAPKDDGKPEAPVAVRVSSGERRREPAPRPAVQTPLDRTQRMRLSRGRIVIEARVDLHGMTQREAHMLLLSFLRSARVKGRRHVLVITGKGSSIGSEGALRRAVPHWFSTPEFRPLVGGWAEAARNHGGEGALYVRLSRDKDRGP